jgi:protein SCO1/2
MRRNGLKYFAVLTLLLLGSVPTFGDPAVARSDPAEARSRGGSRWGANYFPNVPLITHEGKSVRFFDDLIKDKVVIINFIYTSCPDSCPLETARLVDVQRILGDRVGQDVFMYSISIDPKRDTPAVLREYIEKFQVGPGWLFLTGEEADITLLRQKLGVYIQEIQDGSNDHNLSLMIGNQATGRWMKRSPFENPYFLAKQVGNWLHNWKLPDPEANSYADAPKLRTLTMGENLFRTRCAPCHTIGGGDVMEIDDRRVGPDLLGVTRKRDRAWLARWLAEPEKMLAEKDPIAMELYAKYNNVPMPNMRLNEVEVDSLIDYMAAESLRLSPESCCTLEEEESRQGGFWTASMILPGSVLGGALVVLIAVFRRRLPGRGSS